MTSTAQSLCTKITPLVDWEDQFLDWFATQNVGMSESHPCMGQFSYFRFTTQFKTNDGNTIRSYGFSHDRKTAAIKAAAECIERKVMLNFFKTNAHVLPLKALHSSNGWAVHNSLEVATRNAYNEALERHLLLKSYLKFGWSGFNLVEKINISGVEVYFLTSRISAANKVAGLVVAKSPHYQGVSFGYCIGNKLQVHTTEFWQQALYESLDKIMPQDGQMKVCTDKSNSWIISKIVHDLETPFDCGIFMNTQSEIIEEKWPEYKIQTFNLSEINKTSFPLYCAFVWGGDLIPLFHEPILDTDAQKYLMQILEKNSFSRRIPSWHPIV